MKKRGLVLIENDVFDIAREIRRIDDDYRIFYNTVKRRFEVHHTKCNPTLQLVVPYNGLDYRTVVFVQKTRVGRSVNEPDIDGYNEAIEKKAIDKIREDTAYAVKQIYTNAKR